MRDELGPSAADWYLHGCILKYTKVAKDLEQQLFDLSTSEKRHLLNIFETLPLSKSGATTTSLMQDLNPKVDALVELLLSKHTLDFTGLIFVEQRVITAILAEILSRNLRTRHLFSIGTFTGTSTSMKRKGNVGDLAELPNHHDTLDHFRSGEKNLIIATSVLEEGIDISSCHLVICFEPPKNLKSFVQRRGRARQRKSEYLIFMPEGVSVHNWEELEEEMKKAYLDDMRKVKDAEERESQEEGEALSYRVPSTG